MKVNMTNKTYEINNYRWFGLTPKKWDVVLSPVITSHKIPLDRHGMMLFTLFATMDLRKYLDILLIC